MSRVLKHRNKIAIVIILLFLMCLAVQLKQTVLSFFVFIFLLEYILSQVVRRKINEPLFHLHSRRAVEVIDTLIIGDYCQISQLTNWCSLKHSLMIIAPRRSLDSSRLIFKHLTTRIVRGGNVIIIDKGSNADTNPYDYPFLSQIEKLKHPNNNLHDYFLLCKYSLDILLCRPFAKLHKASCPDMEIEEICTRKGFTLTYLHI